MSKDERASWDERYRRGEHASIGPDSFLPQLLDYSSLYLPGRRCLDVACGTGGNAVWLAEQGWKVCACDISLEGLRQARRLAAERAVNLHLFCADLDFAALPADAFDLITCFYFLPRNLFPALRAALRPGGLLVFRTYTTEQANFPGGPRRLEHLLQPQELLREVAGFRVLVYQEIIKDRGVAQLIAQKGIA